MLDTHYQTPNIIIGLAEIYYVPRLKGWIVPGGTVLKDVGQAMHYAYKLNELMVTQTNKQQGLK
jgi:hypothetical protein